MGRRQRQVFIELSPTRHELAVFERGRLIGHRAARPAEGADAGSWAQIVRSLEAELEGWVRELGVAGEQVTAVYTGPDTAAAVHDAPASAGGQRARLAARAAMADTISFPLDQNAHAEVCLHRDRSGGGADQPRLRTLAIADTESTVLSLSMALERGGLRPGRFIPAPGASLAVAVRELLGRADTVSPHVVLWIGEHSSVIAGGVGGRVAFARLIPVGTESLVEALASPLASGRADHPIALDRFSAREMLFASGIPTSDGWRAPSITVDARAVLPLVQPVLQRLVVETKQSIRFGFTPETRPMVVLSVGGPGSHFVGLGETVASGVGVGLADRGADHTSDEAAAQGDLAAVLALGNRAPSLTPRAAVVRRNLSTVRHAVLVGAALAIVAIGAHGVESWQRLREARDTLTTLSGRRGDDSAAVTAVRSALAARAGLARAQTARHESLSRASPSAAMLRALAALTPESIEVTEISLSDDNGVGRCSVRGIVTGDGETSDSDRFGLYTADLAACPLVADLTLGETRRTVQGAAPTLSFSLTLELVSLPTGVATASAGPQEGPTP